MKDFFLLFFLAAVLLMAACTDIRRHIIPNVLILSAVAIRILLYIPLLIQHGIRIGEILIHAAVSVLFPVALCLIAGAVIPGGIGMGDIKLMIVIAFYLDFWESVTAFLYSFLFAAIAALCCFAFRKEKEKPLRLPLAPAFLAGTMFAYFIRL